MAGETHTHGERRTRDARPLGTVDDEEALARAAEVLRDRTMSLEEERPWPGRKLIVSLVAATAVLAAGMVFFRGYLKWLIGLA